MSELPCQWGDKKIQEASGARFGFVGKHNAWGMKHKIAVRRILKGHFGKIYSAHWAPDLHAGGYRLVSASQDGKLVVWNVASTNKLCAISLKSSWVMACAYGPTNDSDKSSLVAAGGLDNLVTVYKLDAEAKASDKPQAELANHEGYVSCIRFFPKKPHILSASGDSTCVLWDYKKNTGIAEFKDAKSDVMSVSIKPGNSNLFLAGACDAKARIYDVRDGSKKAIRSFEGHDSDINSVTWMKQGHMFATGSDDSTCIVWDSRMPGSTMQVLKEDKTPSGVTSLDFSHSGRLCVASYDDSTTPHVYDILNGSIIQVLGESQYKHEERVSCIHVAPDGSAFVTASWDMFLKIWA